MCALQLVELFAAARGGHAHHGRVDQQRLQRVVQRPINKLIPILEAHDIVCGYRDLTPLSTAALASTAASGRTVMLLDTNATRIDLAWAIAHELSHLAVTDVPSKQDETAAEAFAAAFLMPETEILADDALRPVLDLSAVAEAWGVRPRVLAQRLRDLRRVTDAQFRQFVHQASEQAEHPGRRSLLGSPATIADAVSAAGGSHRAAPPALLSTDELRRGYLALPGR